MKNIIVIIVSFALFAGCVISDEKPEQRLKDLEIPTSIKDTNVDSDWKHLVESSKLIAVGSVEEILYVEDETKLYDKIPTSDRNISDSNKLIVPLPNLREAVMGVLVRFRMQEIISTDKQRKNSELINIYVKDGYAPSTDTNIPQFINGHKYLIFLVPLNKADNVKGAIVIQPLNLSKGRSDFDYKSAFKVPENTHGYFKLTESNQHIVDEVRRAIKNQ